jgi:hypothetical protein
MSTTRAQGRAPLGKRFAASRRHAAAMMAAALLGAGVAGCGEHDGDARGTHASIHPEPETPTLQGTPAMRATTTSVPSTAPGTASGQATTLPGTRATNVPDNAAPGSAGASGPRHDDALAAHAQQSAVTVTGLTDLSASSGLAPPVIHTAD